MHLPCGLKCVDGHVRCTDAIDEYHKCYKTNQACASIVMMHGGSRGVCTLVSLESGLPPVVTENDVPTN